MNGRTASVWKIKEFLAVRQVGAWWPFASVVLTVRFPIKWPGVGWEPPPLSMGLGCQFTSHFLSLTLTNRNVSQGLVISMPGSHSLISTLTSSLPSANTPWSLEWTSFFHLWCLFLARCLFLPFCVQAKSCCSALLFFSKRVVRVALLFGPLAPCLAASAAAHLSSSRTVPWLLVLRVLSSAELCSTGPASPAWPPREPSDMSGLDQGDPLGLLQNVPWGLSMNL
jgi:hypothetical protein